MRNPIAIVILVGALGCDGGGGVAVDELGADMGALMCGHFAECCTAEEFMEQTLGAEDEAECRTLYSGLFDQLLVPVLEDSIAAGRVVYHPDRMAECLDALAAMSCTEWNEANADDTTFAGCSDPFEGQVADGGDCAQDFDCVSEHCEGNSLDFEGNVTFGVCAAPPAPQSEPDPEPETTCDGI